MPFFFIVSDFLYNIKEKTGGVYSIKKKAIGLLIPYIVFEILFICFLVLLRIKADGLSNTFQYFFSFITLLGVSVTWFLPCLFLTELIFCLLGKISRVRIAVVIVLMFVGFLLPKSIYWVVLSRCLIGLAFYTIGFYCGSFIFGIKKWYYFCISLVSFVMTAFLNSTVSMNASQYGNPLLFLGSSISGSFCVIQISSFFEKKSMISKFTKAIEFFGRNTLIILCTHMFFIELIRIADNKLFGNILPLLGNVEGLVFGLIVGLFEIPTIIICNRYLWFAFGKKKRVV